MKITLKLFSILLATLLCLTACSDSSATQTENDEQPEITLKADALSAMHLLVNDAAIYNDKVIIRQYSSEKFSDPAADPTKVISLGGKDFSTDYVESFMNFRGATTHQYQSADEKVSFTYSEEIQKFYNISAPLDYFALPNDLKSEEDYLIWIKELLKGYGITDLSAYEYSCETRLTEFGDNWAGGASREYFYKDIDPSCEKLTGYVFKYTRIIGEYVTSDDITININLALNVMKLSFDKGQFTNIEKVELDESKILETLDEYVKGCVNTEKYELLSYKVKYQTLTFVDQKLCLVCSVEMNLNPLEVSDIESFSVLETIGVFCE